VRIFALTENRRINELAGFVGITLAVLLALSLLSYSPQDAAFNVAAAPPSAGPSHNWIGPVGAPRRLGSVRPGDLAGGAVRRDMQPLR